MTDELLFKYISGQADIDEVQEVQLWVNESEERRKEMARLKNIWILAGLENKNAPEKTATETERIWQIIKRLNIREKKREVRIRLLKYAATLLITISIAGTIGYFISYSSFHSPDEYTEIIVPRGERSTVALPDGSTVQLNSDSRLRFLSSFNSGKRKVCLQGEGFFKVKHHRTRSFVVEAGNLQIEVLGTSFNVSNYPDDQMITTYLQSGKVKIINENLTSVFLTPSEAFSYNKTTHQSEKIRLPDQRFTDWTKGILTINGETIGELTKKLERRFDVRILFGDHKVKDNVYTGSIKDENIITVMEALKFASSIKYECKGDTIILFSK